MSVAPFTRPSAGTEKDYEDIANAMDNRVRPKYHKEVHNNFDPRFTKVIAWFAVLFASVLTAAVCWAGSTLISVQKDIAVLLARPEGISKAEFDREANRWDQDITELKRETREIRDRERVANPH